jgi:hypothetical protein
MRRIVRERWRDRAAEIRRVAETIDNPETQRVLQSVAEIYDEVAAGEASRRRVSATPHGKRKDK